jgi:hypothetical protein
MSPLWLWPLAFLGFCASSAFGSFVGIWICSRHWQCPLYQRRQAQGWTDELRKKRGL